MVPRTHHSESRRICNGRKRHKAAGEVGLVFSRRERFRRHLQDLARTAKTVADPLCRPLKDSFQREPGLVAGLPSWPARSISERFTSSQHRSNSSAHCLADGVRETKEPSVWVPE